jgi:hypothetical protein
LTTSNRSQRIFSQLRLARGRRLCGRGLPHPKP